MISPDARKEDLDFPRFNRSGYFPPGGRKEICTIAFDADETALRATRLPSGHLPSTFGAHAAEEGNLLLVVDGKGQDIVDTLAGGLRVATNPRSNLYPCKQLFFTNSEVGPVRVTNHRTSPLP